MQDTIQFGKRVQLVGLGARRLRALPANVVASPRGSIIVKPNDRQAIRLSGSTAFRTPTFLESYLNLPIQLQLPGVELVSASQRSEDPDFKLEPEQIITVEASYLNQQSDYVEFELTAYYNRISNLITLSGARPVTLANRADGLGGLNPETGHYTVAFGGWNNGCETVNVFGGEVGTRVYPVEGLDVFANYALNLSSLEVPAGCAVSKEQSADQRTSQHKVNAGVQLRTKSGVDGEITFHYQSAQTWGEQVATLDGIGTKDFELPALLPAERARRMAVPARGHDG